MKKVEFEIVTLDWYKEDYLSLPNKPGIYQIYGTSPLYGEDTLLYIGSSVNLNERLKGHFNTTDGVIGRQPNKTCRYALLPIESLELVEQILIVMYKPSFNSKGLIKVKSEVSLRPVYIQNHGNRGMLNIENTNFYFLNIIDTEVPFDIILPKEEL